MKQPCSPRRSSKKLKIELPCDPAFPLFSIYLEKTVVQKDAGTPIFTAAPFTIAKTWKQPKCPLTEEWIYIYIHTMVYIYNGILLSHKKNEIMSFAATWMDLEMIILSELSQTKTNII